MRVSYKAEVDNVDYVNTTTTVNIPKNSPDKARIFVAVVDWTGPHTVTSTLEVKSGLPATVIGSWDPETTTDPGEGKIIGYGSLWIEKGKPIGRQSTFRSITTTRQPSLPTASIHL